MNLDSAQSLRKATPSHGQALRMSVLAVRAAAIGALSVSLGATTVGVATAEQASAADRNAGSSTATVDTTEDDVLIASLPRAAKSTVQTASCPSAVGEQRMLVILAKFLDGPGEPYTRQEIDEIVMNSADPNSVNHYIQEVSYGKAWLAGDVLDWTALPANSIDCGSFFDPSTIGNLIALLDPAIDVTIYGRLAIVYSGAAGKCVPGAASTLGPVLIDTSQGQTCASVFRAPVDQTSSLETTHARTMIHELGHSLGVGHALDIECGGMPVGDVPGTCTLSNPGRDRYDVMGQVGLRGHYNAVFKEALGWIEPSQIAIIGALPAEVALDPIEISTTGKLVAKVPAVYDLGPPASSANYFITYRQAIGTDAVFPELGDPKSGVMLRLDASQTAPVVESALIDTSPHFTSRNLTQLDDSADVALAMGETHLDAEKGLAVTFSDLISGRAIITIDPYTPPDSDLSRAAAKCKEAKARAAGKKAAALLTAFGRNARDPDAPKLTLSLSKAQSRLTETFARAESRGGCQTIGDASKVDATVDAFVAAVIE